MKKIIIVNLILVVCLYFLSDFYFFRRDVMWNGRSSYVFKNLKSAVKYYFNTYARIFYTKDDYDAMFIEGKTHDVFFRSPENTESQNKPLLLMGCSFTYGTGLEPNQTLGYKLAHTLDRPVYNRAISAHGVNEMFYQLKSEKFYSKIKQPEWLIYIYMNDHLRRLKIPCSVVDNGVYYKMNDVPELYISRNITTPLIYNLKLHLYKPYSSPETIELYSYLMKQATMALDSHYDEKIKHLALIYEPKNEVNKQVVTALENAGFYVFFAEDLTSVDILSEKYRVSDKLHPSEAAWDILLPSIIEKLETLG